MTGLEEFPEMQSLGFFIYKIEEYCELVIFKVLVGNKRIPLSGYRHSSGNTVVCHNTF